MQHLLILHGALGSIDQFEQLSDLLSSRFHVHCINFSGHGGRPNYSGSFNIDLFCEDINEYVSSKSLTSFYIFGFSMGGYVALAYALQHPGKVIKIFTLGTKFDWSPESASQETDMLNIDKMLEKVPAFTIQLANRHAPGNWKEVVANTSDLMIRLGDLHLGNEDFKKINCAVRICVGEYDKMVSQEHSMKVSEQITSGSFISLPQTPHPIEKVKLDLLVHEINEYFK